MSNEQIPSKQVSRTPKQILVVGDWVVDEFWVIANHRSARASRTGLMHHRAVHGVNASIQSFCGAGKTASILRDARRGEGKDSLFKIAGLGIWADGDEEGLKTLFIPENTMGYNPYRIFQVFKQGCIPVDNVTLLNVGNCLADNNQDNSQKLEFGTARMIRTYLQVGDETTQLQRIDWELQTPEANPGGEPQWPIDSKKLEALPGGEPQWPIDSKKLEALMDEKLGKDVDCVVLKDLGHGVISNNLVKFLANRYPSVPWFISSKSWKPDWLVKNLPRIPLKLLLVPQIATQSAIEHNDINAWITGAGTGYASKKALEQLTGLRDMMGPTIADFIIIVLPENMRALALDFRKESPSKQRGVVFADKSPKLPLETNMASVFFGAAIAHLLEFEDIELKRLVGSSLNYTYRWQKEEIKRVQKPRYWNPTSVPRLRLGDDAEPTPESRDFDIQHAREEWNQALSVSDYGVITDEKGRGRFELWRAMVDVDGYVCCNERKLKNIRRLVRAVDLYAKRHGTYLDAIHHSALPQESCILHANPGAGKTSLVRHLAGNYGLRFIAHNIGQMTKRTDVLDCFDSIVTSYLQNPSEPLLLFIDEINSELENENVYGSFLSPLEDGVYVRGGKAFKLPPSFWVFAGTMSEKELRKRSVKDPTCTPDSHTA